jgi:hypothetical protein
MTKLKLNYLWLNYYFYNSKYLQVAIQKHFKLFVINFTKDQAANPKLESLSDCATCQFALVRHVDNKMHAVALNQEVSASNQSEVGQCFNNIHF